MTSSDIIIIAPFPYWSLNTINVNKSQTYCWVKSWFIQALKEGSRDRQFYGCHPQEVNNWLLRKYHALWVPEKVQPEKPLPISPLSFSISSTRVWNTIARLVQAVCEFDTEDWAPEVFMFSRLVMFGLFAFTFAWVCVTIVSRKIIAHIITTCVATSFYQQRAIFRLNLPLLGEVGQAHRMAASSKLEHSQLSLHFSWNACSTLLSLYK